MLWNVIFIGFFGIGFICLLIPVVFFIVSFVKELIKSFSPKEKEKEKEKQDFIIKRDLAAESKGASFENKIRDLILYYFPGSKVRQNLIIKNGKFSKEIDLIAMTTKGFIVIEAKNYSHCTISGNIKEKNWVCKYNDKEEYSLYNPIFQASSGVWNIKKHIPDVHFDKAVVFADTCKLSKEILNDPNVYTFSSFKNSLLDLMEYDDIYQESFIEELDNKLGSLASVSREEHIKNVELIREMM